MSSQKVVISLEAEASGALRAIKQVTQTVDRLAHRTVGTAGMPQLSRSVQDATRQVRQLENETGRLSGTLSRVKGIIAGAFTVGAITTFGKKALEASANMEVFKKGLSFTLGNSGEADKLVRSIQEIGEASAYDTTQLLPLARQWVNIGETADGARAKMQKIVDLGSAFGMQTDQVQAANLALTQMSMAGKIGAQDMMQLINAGVPAWKLLADSMGLSVAQVRDLSEKGALGQEAINSLWDAITQKTEGAASTMGNTLMAKFSNMQETVANSMAIIGDLITQGFDLKGVLREAGDVAESFKTHLANIRDAAKNIGIKQAIVDELMAVSPAAGTAASAVMGAFSAVSKIIKDNWSAIKSLIEVIVIFGGTYMTINKVYSAIMLVRNGFTLAKLAAMAFNAVSALNPWVLAITAIITVIVLLATHWDEVKQIATAAINTIKGALDTLTSKITNGVLNAIQRAKAAWAEFVEAFKHPIDTVINVVTRNTTVNTGSATGRAKGGLIGYATGGHVRGAGTGTSDSIPALLSNGEYVLTAKTVRRVGVSALDALNQGGSITQYAGGGSNIMAAYNRAKGGGNDTLASISKGIGDAGGITSNLTAYDQAMAGMVDKARQVGTEVARFRDYLGECKTNADAYNASGEKTLAYQKSLAEVTANINQLQGQMGAGEGTEAASARLEALTQQRDTMIANYAAEMDAAKSAYAEAAAYRTTVEAQATTAIANLRKQAETDVYSHATAVAEAKRQSDRANNAESLSEFLDIMATKDEVTGQSYAATLANEQYLAEQRRIWMDELMLSTVTWDEYMQTMLTNMAVQIQDSLATGIAQCVVEGRKFSEVMSNLAKTLLKQLIQGVVQKLISGWITAIGLGNTRHKAEMKNMAAETEAAAAKLSIETGIAAAAAAAAHPHNPASAAAKAVAAVSAATAAGAALGKAAMKAFKTDNGGSEGSKLFGLAKGGVVTGPTAALIGEGRYNEAVLPLKPPLLDKLFGGGNQQTVVATQNIYGDINTREDEEDAMSMFNDTVLAGLRGA